MTRAQDTCIHGYIATQCGAICKKGPGGVISFFSFKNIFIPMKIFSGDVCGGQRGRRSGQAGRWLGQYGQCAEGLQCSDCNR